MVRTSKPIAKQARTKPVCATAMVKFKWKQAGSRAVSLALANKILLSLLTANPLWDEY